MRWGMPLEVLAIVGNHPWMVCFDVMNGIAKRHLTFLVVMAIRFAIGRNVDELRPVARVVERRHQTAGEVLAFLQQVFECDRL